MRYSQAYIPTRREDPADAEVVSHRLLLRAGYIRMLARGVYSFLPLGKRVVRKIEGIIREEMDRAGGLEVFLPSVQPAELWEESGRWDHYGPELMRFEDRKGSRFCYGPTHEEVITDLIRGEVRSYKQLPLNLYQIQTKFRDEIRPRAGLMRGREFVMKDAYSFDVSLAKAQDSYESMRVAYNRMFDRMGLEFRMVEADTGAIGGSSSHEFQVLAQSGEDLITACTGCDYAANVEMTELRAPEVGAEAGDRAALERVATPGKKTVADVTRFLKVEAKDLVKTVILVVDGETIAVLVRGDHDVNPFKVQRLLGANVVALASESTVREATGAPVGFAGPIGLSCRVLADNAVRPMAGFVAGGNEADVHVINVQHGRDFEVGQWADLRLAGEGDPCPRCGEPLATFRGIEVGHIFVLGTKYSESMGAMFLDEQGDTQPIQMGCYGAGVTRILAAAIEQNHDDHGIIWPMPIAPYEVHIVMLGRATDDLTAASTKIHDELETLGIEVLLDDRNERPAVKFKDADLIGVPLRLTLGARGLKEGKIEVKWRTEDKPTLVPLEDAAEHIRALVEGARKG